MKLAWKQIVVAFLFGGIVGFAGAWSGGGRMAQRHWRRGSFPQQLVDRFGSRLRLSDEQRSQVLAILEAKRQKIEALRAEMRPRFEEIRTSTSAEIRQFLSAEQQQRFDALEAEWEAKAKRFRERWKGSDRKDGASGG